MVYFKLRRRFLGKGTQTEAIGKFNINGKALSKILTGKCYMGGKDKKVAAVRKSQPAPTAVKSPEETEGQPMKKRKRVVISSSSSSSNVI